MNESYSREKMFATVWGVDENEARQVLSSYYQKQSEPYSTSYDVLIFRCSEALGTPN
jgi:hypothetical protein